MFYIEKEKTHLVKYEVRKDSEKLFELSEEIILKYGKKTHIKHETSEYETPYDYRRKRSVYDKYIQNYSCFKTTKEIKLSNGTITQAEVYQCEYDEYTYPELAKLVLELINGNYEVLSKIKNGLIEDVTDKRELELKQRLLEIAQKPINESTIEKLDKIKIALKELEQDEKYQENRGLKEYYKKVLDCITFIEVDRISKEQLVEYNDVLKRLEKFFGKNVNNCEIDKMLRK